MTISGVIRIFGVSSVALVVLVLETNATYAQEGTRTPVAHKQVLSANPFLLMFKWFNTEYERKINESNTWGVSGSFFSLEDNEDYMSAQLNYRFYPQGAALTGFYLGGRGGYHHVDVDRDDGQFFGMGFEMGYNWLFGTNRRVSLGLGGGATRLFGGDLDGASMAIPTVRINVGFAF
jgi:hypothetical protein